MSLQLPGCGGALPKPPEHAQDNSAAEEGGCQGPGSGQQQGPGSNAFPALSQELEVVVAWFLGLLKAPEAEVDTGLGVGPGVRSLLDKVPLTVLQGPHPGAKVGTL